MAEKIELKPLSQEDVPKLLNVLKGFLPDSIVMYNWILTQSQWAKDIPELKVTILCPDGDWREGIVVGLADGLAVPDKIYSTLYAPVEAGTEILKNGLLQTNLIEWPRLKLFSAILERFVPAMQEIMRVKGFKHTDDFHVPCYSYYMSQSEAENQPLPDLPKNVRVGPLEVSHLDIVCDNWRHYDPEYRPVVQKMLELNPSFGAFVRNERGEEELASMVVQSEHGGVGLLQTVPEHRRKGYASIVLAYQTRALGRNGVMPHAHVLLWNDGSNLLFQKHQYKVTGVTTWVFLTKLDTI